MASSPRASMEYALAVTALMALVSIAGLRSRRQAFLSPIVVDAVAEGLLPGQLNLQSLMDGRIVLPVSWSSQEELFTD